jgi:hypothetical protein
MMKATGDERLKELLDAYGADRSRWPAADQERFAAEDLSHSPDFLAAAALDRLLAQAAKPVPPAGAEARLAMKIQGMRAAPPRRHLPWAAALPLAASLALGIYLGAIGETDSWLPVGDIAVNEDEASSDLTGIGEAEALAEESRS